jgi:hypothetical protein
VEASRGRIDASVFLSESRNHASRPERSSIAICKKIFGGVRISCNSVPGLWRIRQVKPMAWEYFTVDDIGSVGAHVTDLSSVGALATKTRRGLN